jgi:ferredoxin-type protein NapF
MASSLSRRQFLRGDLSSRNLVVRPPWARAEAEFLARCTRCGDCAPVCATHIIELSDSGYPQVNFKNGECNFCGACARHCSTGALVHSDAAPWTLTARIGDGCLALRGVVCQVCAEHCTTRAIRFSPRLGAVAVPVLSMSACTGCGACVVPCPTQAIAMQPASDALAEAACI